LTQAASAPFVPRIRVRGVSPTGALKVVWLSDFAFEFEQIPIWLVPVLRPALFQSNDTGPVNKYPDGLSLIVDRRP
jgi:hypothetical protein